jgi:dihydrofolate reductase
MLSAIVAFSENQVIGKDNQLLWHLPNDLKRFKDITKGHTIIMGRKTFESLPCVLPERQHIVLTQNEKYVVEDNRVRAVHSVGEMLSLLQLDTHYFVIGGGDIYQKLLPLCEILFVTKIHQEFLGDTKFPEPSLSEWDIVEKEIGVLDNENILPHTFITYKRKH